MTAPMSTACPSDERTLCHWDCGTASPACHDPAEWVLTTACIHERVRSGGICEPHAALVRAAETYSCNCDPLHDHPVTLTWAKVSS